jgi:hypothetical protein
MTNEMPGLMSKEEAYFPVKDLGEPNQRLDEREKEGFSSAIAKKYPHLKRVVGVLDEEDEKFVSAELAKFNAQGVEAVKGEVEKTEKEIEMITMAKKGADEILFQFGGENLYDTPLERIHVLKGNIRGNKDNAGIWDNRTNSIEVKRQSNSVKFIMDAFHEIVHSKAYNALQILHDNGNRSLSLYRYGLEVSARDGKVDYLEALNEAATHELEKIFFAKYIKDNMSFSEKDRYKAMTHGTVHEPEPKYRDNDSGGLLTKIIEDLSDSLFESVKDLPEYSEFKSKEDLKKMIVASAVTGNILKLVKMRETFIGPIKS